MSAAQQLVHADPALEATTDEDRNVPSADRIVLLHQISARLGHRDVSRGFWALCQFADLERLEVFAQSQPFQIEG